MFLVLDKWNVCFKKVCELFESALKQCVIEFDAFWITFGLPTLFAYLPTYLQATFAPYLQIKGIIDWAWG